MKDTTLLLVYNTGNGLFNAISASAHKMVSPKTYSCPLCSHTFGMTGMLTPWKEHLEMQPYRVVYLHRDEFRREYPDYQDFPLPAIFLAESNGTLRLILDSASISEAASLSDLISKFDERLKLESIA